MAEIIAQRLIPPVDYLRKPRVPASYQPLVVKDKGGRIVGMIARVSAVCRTLVECSELVKWFGDAAFCPFLPVLVRAPGEWTAITGWGYASAAELQDCAIAVWNRQDEKLVKMGAMFDFDALRERHGLIRREQADAAVREAIRERIRHHKANPVTDPFRVPQYVRVNEKRVFAVDGTRDG